MTEKEPLTDTREALIDGRPPLVYTHCRIRVTAGPDAGKQIETEKDLVRVGTSGDNDLVLEDPTVSRAHFELRRKKGDFTLVDPGSKNGTFVGSLQVKEATIRRATEITIGSSTLMFEPRSTEVKLEISGRRSCGDMVGDSVAMRELFFIIERVAPTELAVMVTGATGTGKELVARAVHQLSRRRDQPFVTLACGALPAALLESALFGHEAGAMAGADAPYPGAFERAQGGTLFLEELNELPLDLQPRLLRAIERGEIQRFRGQAPVRVDVRLVAASSVDIKALVADGKFRDDLYYRLAEIRIDLPPLEERPEDIPALAQAFFQRYRDQIEATGSKASRLGSGALIALERYPFPGNVRELMNILRRGVAVATGPEILASDLPPEVTGARAPSRTERAPASQVLLLDSSLRFKDAKAQVLDAFERQYLLDLLQRHHMHISRASREAGIDRRHLYRLLDKYGIEMKERELEE